jgi:hypothetical protein
MTVEQNKFSIDDFEDYLRVHNDTIGALQLKRENGTVTD